MLVFVQRRRQLEIVLLVLRIEGLRRQQGHFNPVEQLKHPFNLECRRPTGEFTFLAALLDGDAFDGVGLHKRLHLGGEGFDVGGVIVVFQSDFLAGQGDMAQRLVIQGGDSDDGFAAFDFDAAGFHERPWVS